MQQVQISKGRHVALARRRLERESLLPFDPRDHDISRAKALLRAAGEQKQSG